MQYYSAKIRLAGSMMNEVRRDGISAPEIMLLKRIHGSDALVDVEYDKKGQIVHADERQRLFTQYPTAVNAEAKRHLVEELFGPAHQDLPLEVAEYKGLRNKPASKPTVENIVE